MTRRALRDAEDVRIRSYRIPTTATGAGLPTFVILHGVGLSHRVYGRLGRILARAGNVVSFDLPGFGASPRPDRKLTVEDQAEVVAGQLDRMGVDSAILIGHSMGAQFSVEVAARRSDLASRVILIGPVVDDEHRSLRAQAWGLLRDAPLEPPLTQVAVTYDYLRCGIPWFLAEAVAMRDYPTHLRVKDLTQPLLVLRGEHDHIAKAAWCDWLSEQVAVGESVTIPGTRHNVPIAAPAATAAAIRAFLRDVG